MVKWIKMKEEIVTDEEVIGEEVEVVTEPDAELVNETEEVVKEEIKVVGITITKKSKPEDPKKKERALLKFLRHPEK